MFSRLRNQWTDIARRRLRPQADVDEGAAGPSTASGVSRPRPAVVEGTIYNLDTPGDTTGGPTVSIPEMITTCLTTSWDRTIAIAGDNVYNGSEVHAMIVMYARRFVAHGVKPKSRVWAKLHNTLENWCAAVGVIFAGGILFLSSNTLVEGASTTLLLQSGARFILTDEKSRPLLQEWISTDSSIVNPQFTYLRSGLEDGASSSGDEQSLYEPHHPGKNHTIGFVLYTPGYTGPPKAVEFSHKAYVSAFLLCQALGHVTEDDVYLALSPLAHAFGFTLNVFPMLIGAVTIFEEPTLTFKELGNVLETRRVTAMFCFPKIMLGILQGAKEASRFWKKSYKFPAVDKVMIGGQWIPEHLPRKLMKRFGCKHLWRYYGLTETLGVVVESEYLGNSAVFEGLPVPKIKVKYMPPSDDYEPCPPRTNGELCVMSPTMMTCYYTVPAHIGSGKPPPFASGLKYAADTFLRTGDYGWCSSTGYIELHGKVCDIMNQAGLLALPHEFEDTLRGLGFIEAICVFGAPSESVPKAFIVPKQPLDIEEREAQSQVSDFMRRHGAACLTGGVSFIQCLHRLEDGRVLRRAFQTR